MLPKAFYIVDVFAEEKYAGNQLAVFREGKKISETDMQRFAKEMNYSETTFILSEEERDGGYDVRIFTPENELPFAGHPTLGTAFIIQQKIIQKPVPKVNLNLKIGQIPVSFNYRGSEADLLWMEQKSPTFGEVLDPGALSQVLSVDKEEIDERFPIEEVSTGVPDIIVPLKTLEAVKKAKIVSDKYYALIENLDAKAILVFCPEAYNKENALNVRFFADYYGVSEDPATGSANGCLAGYLVKNRYIGERYIDIQVEQGYEIGRPSILYLKAEEKEGGDIDVHVGGRVVLIAEGQFI